jgi:DNA-binding MarR family transcriptional regulator
MGSEGVEVDVAMSAAGPTEQDVSAESLARSSEVYLAIGRIMRALRRVDPNKSMTAGCASALGVISQAGPLRLRELAEAEGVSAPTMSRMVGTLESSGYVTRTADPTDARAALLELTPEGQELINGMRSARLQHLAEALDRLPGNTATVLAEALHLLEADLRGR